MRCLENDKTEIAELWKWDFGGIMWTKLHDHVTHEAVREKLGMPTTVNIFDSAKFIIRWFCATQEVRSPE